MYRIQTWKQGNLIISTSIPQITFVEEMVNILEVILLKSALWSMSDKPFPVNIINVMLPTPTCGTAKRKNPQNYTSSVKEIAHIIIFLSRSSNWTILKQLKYNWGHMDTIPGTTHIYCSQIFSFITAFWNSQSQSHF